MDNFYTIVIVIAIILLIGILTYIGMLMNDSSGSEIYPPSSTTCPDYWEITAGGKCKIPQSGGKNRGTLFNEHGSIQANSSTTPGLVDDAVINFNDDGWNKSGNSVCAKKHWANTYGIVWDGISNYNDC